jgi:cyclopropane fatty-acyl-phospholipid synthase-like methyltransferase
LCRERLLCKLATVPHFEKIVGVDVSPTALERALDRMERRRMPAACRKAILLIQGSFVYRDDRLKGFDSAALVEVVEHIDPTRLKAFENCVIKVAARGRVVVTTPNLILRL